MARINSKVSMYSFNCRSLKSSVSEINDICNESDFVFLQEHWLLPNDLNILSSINKYFLAVGHSAVDLSSGILIGRPYGGTAILYRKSLSKHVVLLDTCNPRISALIFKCDCGPILLVSAYMPTDLGDSECLETYIETCAYITALFRDCEAVQLVIAGDFNCRVGSRFYDAFLSFAVDNRLCLTDLHRLKDVFTFCNDAGTSFTWIDHFLCSQAVDNLVADCAVHYQYVSSDHKPISVTFNQMLPSYDSISADRSNLLPVSKSLPDWSNCDDLSIVNYQSELELALAGINIPSVLLGSCIENSKSVLCGNLIDKYYNDIVSCINDACRTCIPSRQSHGGISEYVIPGWNAYVAEKHEAARRAFLEWAFAGKP